MPFTKYDLEGLGSSPQVSVFSTWNMGYLFLAHKVGVRIKGDKSI